MREGMNRLWVRLSLAFSGLILIWVLLVALVPPLIIQSAAPHTPRAYLHLAEALGQFYVAHQGWDGIDEFLRGAQAALSPDQSNIILSDTDGRVLYGGQAADTSAQPQELVDPAKNLPVQLDGRTIAYLYMGPDNGPPPPGSDRFLLQQLVRFLFLAAVVGGPSAILSGILMSRNLTAPLNRLAEAAREIGACAAAGGARNFGRHVEPAGTTEMIEVAQSFNEMVDGLQRGEALRRNLMADVAHELRTPLTVLRGSLQAILDDVYPLTKEEITSLYDQTRHLSHLVNDLHQLAQAEAGQLPLNRQPTDLAALAHDVAAAFEPVAEAEGVTLKVDVPDHLAPVDADSARLTQVLYNFMSNALRHTPAGGEIALRGGPDRACGSVWLAVQDSGEGISAEHLPHVFERFYRADPARGRDTGGAGLGLAVARAIVEEHGGQVTAASDGVPGLGSTFTVRLPVAAG